MRKTFVKWGLVLAVLGASSSFASASYANRTLGLGVGGFGIVGDNRTGINYGVPITLEGSVYLDSGFEVYLRIPFIFAYQPVGVLPNGDGGTVFGTGGWLGLRYLFLEDNIRPYAFLEVSGLYFFRPTQDGSQSAYNSFFAGPGAGLGIEFFVAESVSLGAKGFVDMFITLNPTSVGFAIGGSGNFTVYF